MEVVATTVFVHPSHYSPLYKISVDSSSYSRPYATADFSSLPTSGTSTLIYPPHSTTYAHSHGPNSTRPSNKRRHWALCFENVGRSRQAESTGVHPWGALPR